MNLLFDIGHPGQVHLLRNVHKQLIKNGHSIWVTVKNIPVIKELLNKYNISYFDIGEKRDSIFGKAINQLDYNLKVYRLIKKYKIEIGVGSSITIPQLSKITRMKSILLDDDDDQVQPLFVKFAHPFSDILLSPEALKGNRKKENTIYYAGYHELAYLHPNNFTPNIKFLKELGIKKDENFFIMRFNAFKAHHDTNAQGLSLKQKLRLIEILKKYGKVFITTERSIEDEFKEYQLSVSPEKIHHLLYYAKMFIGDSQTMTSEAAVLGTPAIRCNSFVRKISYLEEQENRYGLTYGFLPENFNSMIIKILELLDLSNLKEVFQKRRKIMLSEKIDVTAFMVWFIENYPKCIGILNTDNNYQYKFK